MLYNNGPSIGVGVFTCAGLNEKETPMKSQSNRNSLTQIRVVLRERVQRSIGFIRCSDGVIMKVSSKEVTLFEHLPDDAIVILRPYDRYQNYVLRNMRVAIQFMSEDIQALKDCYSKSPEGRPDHKSVLSKVSLEHYGKGSQVKFHKGTYEPAKVIEEIQS